MIGRNRMPNTRKTNGKTVIKSEVNDEMAIIWTPNKIALKLTVRDHNTYPEIVPDDTTDCNKYDKTQHENPSVIKQLPNHYQRQFTDTTRAVTEKYDVAPIQDAVICTNCKPQNNEHHLVFTLEFEVNQ